MGVFSGAVPGASECTAKGVSQARSASLVCGGAPVFAFSPCSVGFLHSFFWSNMPMYASVQSVSDRSAFSKVVPDSTALLKTAPFRSGESGGARR